MNLLSRLLHVLLCLALVAGGPGVAGIGSLHAMPGREAPVEAAGGCHDAAAGGASSGVHDASSVPAPSSSGDGCCDEGACPCPGFASFALVLTMRDGAHVPRPAEAPPAVDAAARGPPRLAGALRPPIG